jgi:hypothetical protein
MAGFDTTREKISHSSRSMVTIGDYSPMVTIDECGGGAAT